MKYPPQTVWIVLVLSISPSAFAQGLREKQGVLILLNESTLTGQITAVEEGYSVRSTSGETVIPRARVLKLCESAVEAHQFLRGRANLRDPDELMRLARWCDSHGLKKEAREEIGAVLALQPRHLGAQRLLTTLDAAGQTASTPKPSLPARSSETVSTPIPGSAKEAASAVETLPHFTQRVQPLLLNSCGGCHSNGRCKFNLLRPGSSSGHTPALSRQNLSSAAAWIDKADSSTSLLLLKSVEAHGGGSKPPLGSRESSSYKALEAWVKKVSPPPATDTLVSESIIRPEHAASGTFAEKAEASPEPEKASAKPASEPIKAATEPKPEKEDTLPLDPVEQRRVQSLLKAGEVVGTSQSRTREKPALTPADPFDPLPFNQRFHPGRS